MKVEKFEVPAATLSNEDIIRCRAIAMQRRDAVHAIAVSVAAETGVPVRAIYSRDRKRQSVEARQLVMFIAHANGISLPLIGQAMDRDHATVWHGIRAEQARRSGV